MMTGPNPLGLLPFVWSTFLAIPTRWVAQFWFLYYKQQVPLNKSILVPLFGDIFAYMMSIVLWFVVGGEVIFIVGSYFFLPTVGVLLASAYLLDQSFMKGGKIAVFTQIANLAIFLLITLAIFVILLVI